MSAKAMVSFVSVVVVLFVGVGACSDSGSQAPNATGKSLSAKKPIDRGPWPYLGKQGETGNLAEDLLLKNFVVIFDGSGSMSERKCAGGRTKYEVAKEAVLEWSQSVPANANVGLVSFHNEGWSELPLAGYDKKAVFKTIQGIRPGGKTPLSAAMMRAYRMLTPQARRQLGYGEYAIVVITDGIANSPPTLVKTVNSILDRTPIMIHTIGFCIGRKHSLNQPGRTYYRAANDPAALRRGLQDVLAESETFDVSDFKE